MALARFGDGADMRNDHLFRGYGFVWDCPARSDERERPWLFAPGALDLTSRIELRGYHLEDAPFGSTTEGDLSLWEDLHGVACAFTPQLNRYTPALQRGICDLSACGLSFTTRF